MKNQEKKLHLGCGSNILPGYINIDKECRDGVQYDLNSDILDLKFDNNSIDEIYSSHVFEHFHRYQAVALMFVWNNWLKENGRLIIATPDFEVCCMQYLNLLTPLIITKKILYSIKYRENYFKSNRWKVLRNVFGSKEAEWASHLEGWDRFTLSYLYNLLGFKVVSIRQSKFKRAIPGNIRIIGEKQRHIGYNEFEKLAREFLSKMVINDSELSIWLNQALKSRDKFMNNKNFSPILKNLKVE